VTEKLVCIRSDAGYYRCPQKMAESIILSDHTSHWEYTSKAAWKRNGGKYIKAEAWKT
jgi:hypothetical protein